MKVLYFHQHFSTPKGAAGTRSYEMARALIRNGHSVTMVCGSYQSGVTGLNEPMRRGVRRGVVDEIDVIEFNLAYSNSDNFFKRAFTFIKFSWQGTVIALRENYDVLFATSTPLTAAIPGIAARWLRGARFIFEVRDLWPELPRAMGVIRNPMVLSAISLLEWTAYRSAHRLIGLSPGIVAGIARRAPKKNVSMVPNGCDFEAFAGGQKPWRPESVSGSDLMAVFAGTHGIANGLDAVLNVAAVLKARGRSDIKLVLVGSGKLKPGLQARALRDALDCVIFHDPVPKTRLAGLLRDADIGLQILANVEAFYDGTSPNKFFDYLAAGLPIMTNYPGWLAGKVAEYECGFAVRPEDPEALADALCAAADNRAALRAMGERAAVLGHAEFDRSELSARFVDVLEDVAR